METRRDRPLQISLTIQSTEATLLEGLEVWLRLGLLSDSQVRDLGSTYLSCPLPATVTTRTPATATMSEIAASPTARVPDFITDADAVDEVPRPTRARQTPSVVMPPNPAAIALQSFMAEVSVLWLLFLGVFMVVVSSAVLAASQWKNVSPVGQYGILFAYTLVFWGISAWAGQKPNLQLTARMLRVTTLLIIPVNFWMMDGFRLWRSGFGWGVGVIAALSLTTSLIQLLRPRISPSSHPRLILANSIGLSWLHWGWAIPGFPIVASYMGAIATALVLFYQGQTRRQPDRSNLSVPDHSGVSADPDTRSDAAVASSPLRPGGGPSFSLGAITIAFSTLLLIGRAVLVAQVPISRLGLALGICGWLLGWLSRREPSQEVWAPAGFGLLLVGWLVSVGELPWQALAVSSLGVWLLADRLQRSRRVVDLIALFLVGLQTYALIWRVIPPTWRDAVIEGCIRLLGQDGLPAALIGIGGFPYLILTLVVAAWLRRSAAPELAFYAEQMALILGWLLTLVSLLNPWVRAINLLLSTLTLAGVVQRRSAASMTLIYLTHTVGLGAIAAWLRVVFPAWTINAWLVVLLVGAIAEWGVSLTPSSTTDGHRWRQSAWSLGLVLAALSYTLLLNANLSKPDTWQPMWIVIPAALTFISFHRHALDPELAGWLSVAAVLMVQPLTLDADLPRLTSLGIGTLLLGLNTYRLCALVPAVLTVGLGLGVGGAALWHVFQARMTIEWWAISLASVLPVLWGLHGGLRQRRDRVLHLYAKATDAWAMAITIPLMMGLIFYNLTIFLLSESFAWQALLTATLVTLALSYRTWLQPTNLGFYATGLAVELLAASAIATHAKPLGWTKSLDWLAIATISLGGISQLGGDWLIRSYQSSPAPAISPPSSAVTPRRPFASWHVIPLLYALLGLLLAHHHYTAYTGLYTLAVTLIGIGIGRRDPGFKPITVLALLGMSAAAYELLIYQLLQMNAGRAGDGFGALAVLAAAIAVLQRVFSRWLQALLRLTPLELQGIAHVHWGLGTAWVILALASSLSPTGERVWLSVTSVLAAYALIQGRSSPSWIYAGLLEAGAAFGYLLSMLLPDTVLTHWSAAISCPVAVLLYSLPWQQWGWSSRPWRNSASVLPALITTLTFWSVSTQSLLIVAAFYAGLAKTEAQIRISYISVLLADWAVLRLMDEYQITEPLWYAIWLGGSLLYIAHVDPGLRSPSERDRRHLLRSLATGLICFTAIYQSEVGIPGIAPVLLGFLIIGFSLAFILAGIALRVRAFLYLGTITFVIRVLRQVWLFLNDYSLFLWAVGIALGAALIWIALTFEARRSQVMAFMQYWLTELGAWE